MKFSRINMNLKSSYLRKSVTITTALMTIKNLSCSNVCGKLNNIKALFHMIVFLRKALLTQC